MEDLEIKKVKRRQQFYRKMADRQIEEVIAQIMSMADYDEKKFNRISGASERTVSLVSDVSNSSDILNDS